MNTNPSIPKSALGTVIRHVSEKKWLLSLYDEGPKEVEARNIGSGSPVIGSIVHTLRSMLMDGVVVWWFDDWQFQERDWA